MDNLNYEVKKYLLVCKDTKGLSPLSIKAYKTDFKQYCTYMNLRNPICKEDISTYINLLYKQYKPKSANRKIACIKSFYKYMETENIIKDNPFHKIRIKHKMPILLPKTIPLNYVKNILEYSYETIENSKTSLKKEESLRNSVLLELLFSTGMRVSEISNLKCENLDLKDRTIRIVGKGAKERIICIANNQITSMIEKYIDTYNPDSEYIFKNRLGNRLSEQSIRNMVNTYAKAAGVPKHITPHMFRHTFATALLEEDVDLRYIQQLLGHSSIVTTQIYTHISTSKIRHILEDKHPRNGFDFTLNLNF